MPPACDDAESIRTGPGPPGAPCETAPGRLGRVSTSTSTRTSVALEDARPRGSRWLWVLPALTFLVGLALGALVVGGPSDAPVSGTGDPAAAPAPEPSAAPSDLLVRVPEPCLAVAEQAEEAVAVVDRAVAAVRSFDARELQEVLNQAQNLRSGVERLAADCRARAGRDAVGGETVTSTPTPGAAPASTATSSPAASPTRPTGQTSPTAAGTSPGTGPTPGR
jgi:hypothetical protein